MARKKLSPSELVQRARQNGFKDDMTGISDLVVYQPLEPWTRRLYDQTWELWIEYVSSSLSPLII